MLGTHDNLLEVWNLRIHESLFYQMGLGWGSGESVLGIKDGESGVSVLKHHNMRRKDDAGPLLRASILDERRTVRGGPDWKSWFQWSPSEKRKWVK